MWMPALQHEIVKKGKHNRNFHKESYSIDVSKNIFWLLQDPICFLKELDCVNKVKVDTAGCLKPCSGLLVTSFFKSEQNKKIEDLFPIFNAYNTYKMVTKYPTGFGKYNTEH